MSLLTALSIATPISANLFVLDGRISKPSNCSIFNIAKKLPAKEISTVIFLPNSGILTSTFSLYKNEGTLSKVTLFALPLTTSTSPLTSPDGVSRVIVVIGSFTSTIPSSTAAVIAPIVPCPHMSRYPPPSMKIIPKSASFFVGAVMIEPNMSLCPLGSCIATVLT